MSKFALALAVVFNATANVLIKYGAVRLRQTDKNLLVAALTNIHIILGLTSFTIAICGYFYALRTIPLSIAYPVMTSLGFLLVVLVSGFLFAEHLNFIQYIGIVLLLAGLVLLNQGAVVR